MSEEQSMGIRDLRAELGHRIDAAYFHNEPTIVTKNGEPRAVLVPYAWYEQHQEDDRSG